MDDLLAQFKDARRTERALYAKLQTEMDATGEAWSYARSALWDEYMGARDRFQRLSERFADYLLGVE